MYGLFTYIWLKCLVNAGKYTIHGSYGISFTKRSVRFVSMLLPSMTCILVNGLKSSTSWSAGKCLAYLSGQSIYQILNLIVLRAFLGTRIPENFSAYRHWGDYSAGNDIMNCPDLWYIPTFPGLWTSKSWSVWNSQIVSTLRLPKDPPSWKGERTCITQRAKGPQNSHVWGVGILRAGLFWQRYADEKKLMSVLAKIHWWTKTDWWNLPMSRSVLGGFSRVGKEQHIFVQVANKKTHWQLKPVHLWKLTWLAGKPPIVSGNTSSFMVDFPASHLSFRRV